ncbi:MAG: Muramoyltetrapeptide carboxypeptidase [Thermoleophilia bacterium]|nr:Muramoyltetrapeptide carboxypeptidase [Thermoleophilia bacterium]
MPLVIPPALRAGDVVAVVSPSWGGPGAIPHRYEAGRRQLEERFGLVVREMPHARAAPEWVAGHPAARAADLHAALVDPTVRGIFTSIGGDDSIRVLPHLDLELIRAHPKVLLGFSDTTCIHMAWRRAGVMSYYGSSVMCAFAENGGIDPYFARGLEATIFNPGQPPGAWPANDEGWTVERLSWEEPANQSRRRIRTPATPPRWLQGAGRVEGPLLPACVEVLDWLRGTEWWPSLDGVVLALETSEEQPSPEEVLRMLRPLAASGELASIAALLFGRPGGHELDPSEHAAYDEMLLAFVTDELGRPNLPIVTGLDFGHTDPPWTLPVGVHTVVDPASRQISFTEPCVSAPEPTEAGLGAPE